MGGTVELRALDTDLAVHLPLQVHKYRLARRHIAFELVQCAFQGHRLAGQHHRAILASAHAQRAYAMRITESQQAMTGDQGNHGIRTLDAFVNPAHGSKHIGRRERQAARGFLQLMRHHIEQHFGVTFRVDVAVVNRKQLGTQRLRIGQIAVVHQHNAKGRIHIKGLRFFFAESIASGWVAHLPQAAIARQCTHVAGAEHVAHHALGLVHEELAVLLGDDARRILPAVLQKQQSVINQLIDWRGTDHPDDSTHGSTQSVKV
mgnify:CR=1 FL=1